MEAAVATTTFGDRIAAAVERKRTQLVVGLDPVVDLLPVELLGEATGPEGRANATAHYHESDDRHTGGISSLAKSRRLASVIGESSIAAIESSMHLPENERDYRFDRLRSE